MLTAILSRVGWFAVAAIAAACLGVLALHRGETINVVKPWRHEQPSGPRRWPTEGDG